MIAIQSRIGYENQLNLLAARRNKYEASERLATTQLRSAEINLERTKIYSPVDGVIVRENAELNSFIQRGSPIVTLDDVSKAEVAVNLRMDQLHWVLDQQRQPPEHAADSVPDSAEDGVNNRVGEPAGAGAPRGRATRCQRRRRSSNMRLPAWRQSISLERDVIALRWDRVGCTQSDRAGVDCRRPSEPIRWRQ